MLFNTAVEAVRSAGTDDDNLSSASEIEPDEGSVTDGYSAADEDTSEDAKAESEGSEKGGAEKRAADTGTEAKEKAAAGKSSNVTAAEERKMPTSSLSRNPFPKRTPPRRASSMNRTAQVVGF
jgi:hypothetical protein